MYTRSPNKFIVILSNQEEWQVVMIIPPLSQFMDQWVYGCAILNRAEMKATFCLQLYSLIVEGSIDSHDFILALSPILFRDSDAVSRWKKDSGPAA